MPLTSETLPLLSRGMNRKQRLLTVLRAKVFLLREQLEVAEIECKALENELARNLSQPAYSKAGIGNLPTETLLQIFALALLEDHRHIGSLLSVCKRWNGIIVNYPDLWTTISLRITLKRSDMTKELGYYKTCVERSRDKLLTVSISEGKRGMGGYALNPYLIDWLVSGECESLRESIRGVGSSILKRYKALHVSVAKDYMDPHILAGLFAGDTPNISCASFSDLDLDDHDQIVEWTHSLSSSTIKTLSLGSKGTLSRYFKDVTVLDCYGGKNLRRLPSLQSLETLVLRSNGCKDYVEMSIDLPRLRKLSLVGIWNLEILQAFDLPALSCLTFVTGEEINFSPALEVKLVELHWETLRPHRLPKISNELVASLGSVLNKYNTVKIIKVPSFMKHLVLDAFKILADQGMVYVEILG
jgi:hypothetical protein